MPPIYLKLNDPVGLYHQLHLATMSARDTHIETVN